MGQLCIDRQPRMIQMYEKHSEERKEVDEDFTQ